MYNTKTILHRYSAQDIKIAMYFGTYLLGQWLSLRFYIVNLLKHLARQGLREDRVVEYPAYCGKWKVIEVLLLDR